MLSSSTVVELERVRLSNRTERVAVTTGLGLWGGFLFGFLFVAMGAFILLLGLKVVYIDPSSVHAPYWVLSLLGGTFATSGMIVWSMILQERRQVKKRQILAAQHPFSQVFADYPWDPKGITKSPWSLARKSLAATIFFAVFMAPFNWWAWGSEEDRLMVKIIVSVFDLCLIFAGIELVRRILAALKYGHSRIEYNIFPLLTGGRIDLRWLAPSGLENATSITFALRCVEEWTESRGAGKNRSNYLIHEQLWAATRTTQGHGECPPNRPTFLSFDVPATAPGSNLSGKLRITFWELEVNAKAPGVDFQERYLVPVYPGAV